MRHLTFKLMADEIAGSLRGRDVGRELLDEVHVPVTEI